jgi:hypothetical protein
MSATIIDPDYNWKQAAAQEGVDYDAVMKSFMDQSYGVVANKAKVLFQDPFRLGFEVVHRNEKATKMVGIFAFRCNDELLFAPVFFVNGEIKAADMLYRSGVKRFVPLTEEWCSYLVRGANQTGGELVDKGRRRQADAYMDRLAYPQRVKYATAEGVAVFQEMVRHCADNTDMPQLLPDVICQEGPAALEKLAALIEGSEIAQRFVVEHYTEEQLSNVSRWQEKAARAGDNEAVVFVSDPVLSKEASAREQIMRRGYTLIDKRASGSIVIDEVDNGTIFELSACGPVDLLLEDGSVEGAVLLSRSYNLGPYDDCPVGVVSDYVESRSFNPRPDTLYFPSDKKLMEYGKPVFGDTPADCAMPAGVKAPDVGKGKAYIAVCGQECSDLFMVKDKVEDGDSVVLHCLSSWGSPRKLVYAAGRDRKARGFCSDETVFLEVDAEIKTYDDGRVNEVRALPCSSIPMSAAGIDQWLRTAGGTGKSVDVEVKRNHDATFDITTRDGDVVVKRARDLGMLEAHLALATDFEIKCDKAGEIIDKAVDDSVTRFRVFSSGEKSAFVTRAQGMQPWVESFDPELNVKLDTPQRQVLATFTPERGRQTSRYGDHWERPNHGVRDPEDDGLPADALFSKSPEDLAVMADQYQMPHIFDHGMLLQMAKSTFSAIDQVQKYIPDLETGVDRYYRILFLLRYRPADFEEAYGKDAILEMEQEIGELASMAGDNLLQLLKRFDTQKLTAQQS